MTSINLFYIRKVKNMARKVENQDLSKYTERVVEQKPKEVEKEQATLFPSLEGEFEEEFEVPYEFERYTLRDLNHGDTFEGKPYMSEVHQFSFDQDGVEVTKNRFKLFLVDEDSEEYLDINVNLKTEGDVQKNIHKRSVLYDFIASIQDLNGSQFSSLYNRIKIVNLSEFREYINSMDVMTIKALERTGRISYMSFCVVELKK